MASLFSRIHWGTGQSERWDGWRRTFDALHPQNRIVVDVGAGLPDSVAYWLKRGAAFVFAYESGRKGQVYLARTYSQDPRVSLHGAWNGEALPAADVLKLDCEGCERALSPVALARYSEWSVALHQSTFDKREMLRSMGGRLAFVTPDRKEEVYVRSLP